MKKQLIAKIEELKKTMDCEINNCSQACGSQAYYEGINDAIKVIKEAKFK